MCSKNGESFSVIKDRVLKKEELENLQNILFKSREFPMYYIDSVAFDNENKLGNYYHVHTVFDDFEWLGNRRVVEPLLRVINPKALIKIKINFYPRTDKILKHAYHTDQSFDCNSALFFVNDNDGYTYLKREAKRVESKANRMLYFNSAYPHYSTTCTNKNIRCTININYF